MLRRSLTHLSPLALLLLLGASSAMAQGSAFTFQGKLTNNGTPTTGSYDMEFKLFDTPGVGTGTQRGPTVSLPTVQVANGLFTVELDFTAAVFDGAPHFLEIGVRLTGNPESHTVLAPRQPLTSAPYAVRSAAATAADGLSVACVNCVTSSQIQSVDGAQVTGTIAGNQISGAIPVESVPLGSGNYIQNATEARRRGRNALQQAASFNIEGDGIVGGSLGVGTTLPPISRVHVVSDPTAFPPRLESTGTASFAAGWDFYHGTIGKGYVGVPSGGFAPGELLLFGGAGTQLSFWPGGIRAMTIDTFGHVGIGTTLAQAQLHVHNSGPVSSMNLSTGSGSEGPSSFRLQADSGLGGQGKSFVIYDNVAARYRMVINGAGFVGLGTPTPLTPLEISSVSPVITLRDVQPGIGLNAPAFIQNSGGSLVFKSTGIGPNDAAMVIRTGDGQVSVKVLQILGGADLSENFDVRGTGSLNRAAVAADIRPGMVVTIDPVDVGKLVVSRQAYDRRVAGIISGAGGVKPGLMMGQQGSIADGKYPVALTGRVWVYCDATRRPIKPGDLLTSSAVRGHAMKVGSHAKAQGAIIGKAMTGLKAGRGLVLVLVTLQ